MITSLSLLLVAFYAWSDQSSIDKAILDQHNYYRSIAGIPLMTWDKNIAASAQKWADKLKSSNGCRMEHSSHTYRKNVGGFSYIGENLYWAWSSASVSADAAAGKNAVDSWYAEIAYFQYSSKGVVCPRRGKKGAIGHFTQVMWDKSTRLGCGYAVCGGKSLVIVCQYGPGGNFNMHITPPFDAKAAEKLDKHPVNKKFGGLPRCD